MKSIPNTIKSPSEVKQQSSSMTSNKNNLSLVRPSDLVTSRAQLVELALSRVDLLPHQMEAIDQLSSGKILWGGVGVGKSMTALAYYMKKEAINDEGNPVDLVIITTAKKRDSLDWEQEAAKFGLSTTRDYSCAGLLTVDSWNNIGKYEDMEDAFFIFDEQRIVGAGTWVKKFQKIAKRNRWILLSATPGDTWIDYVPVFVANGLFRNPTQFKREHVLYAPYSRFPKIARYIGVETLEKYRNMLLVEMPYEMPFEIVEEEIICQYDEIKYQTVLKKRWNVFENRPCKDISETMRVLRRIVNTDCSRLDVLERVLHRKQKVIVFYNFNYELEILRSWLAMNSISYSEWNGHKHEDPPLEEDVWVYLVQYTAGAEGWNSTYSDTILFWSQSYSWRTFMQAKGRIARLNTPFKKVEYYILISDSSIDKAIRNARLHKKIFNERAWFVKNMGADQVVWDEAA